MGKPLTQPELFSLTPRKGAPRGRRPRPEREGLAPHRLRPVHDPKNRVHVWNVRAPEAPSLRSAEVQKEIAAKIVDLKDRGPRVLRYTVTEDAVYLLVEADDGDELSRQVQLLFSRVAFGVNRVLHRTGSLFRGRHHREELTTPAQERRTVAEFYAGTDSVPGPHAK